MSKVVEIFILAKLYLSKRLVTILSLTLAAESGKGNEREPRVQLGKWPRHTPTHIANYKMVKT